MTQNEQAILDSILSSKKIEYSQEISDSDFFEIFAIEQILKGYEISNEEIEDGNVDQRGDGQIDGFYTFVNSELLQEDTDISDIKRDPRFEVYIIQVKTSASYQETTIERMTATIRNIFNLTVDSGTLGLYNSQLVDKVELFKRFYTSLSAKHPKLAVSIYYVTKGDTDNIHQNVLTNGDLLKETIIGLFRDSDVKINYYGARELIELYNQRKEYTLQIKFHENAISTATNNYIILCTLLDYLKFVTDERNNLLKHIFEANVRDYQGDVEVNRDIYLSLKADDPDIDFWWLNNGITILATNATTHGKIITLDNVQIVNGLQTTMEIWNYFKNKEFAEDVKDTSRSLLIRIIVSEDAEIRDRIIKATNFQTRIPPPSLRATDRIQRNIETYFLTNDWYYDRRKNYYKNIGKPASRIIDIPLLSQTMMAILLKEPYQARSRPTAIIKNDSEYAKLFNDSIPPQIYLSCSKIIKKIESLIRTDISNYPVSEKANFKFHVSMILIILSSGKKDYSLEDLLGISIDTIPREIIEESFNRTIELAHRFAESREWDLNRTSKNQEFDEYLKNNWPH